jgi:hypothetical protein
MLFYFPLLSGALLAGFCCSQTLGQAVVVNSCSSTIWYTSVDCETPAATSLPPGQNYTKIFQRPCLDPRSGTPVGTSIKVSYDQRLSTGDITQFEYFYNSTSSKIDYNISIVDGHPFKVNGLILQGTSNECPTLICSPGENPCPGVSTHPDDSSHLTGCHSSNTVILTLCPNPARFPPGSKKASSINTSFTDAPATTSSKTIIYSEATTYSSATTKPMPPPSNTLIVEPKILLCSVTSPCKGEITYFDTATDWQHPSACLTTNNGTTENVVALAQGIMGPESNNNPNCNRTISVSVNGKKATAKVVDKCPSCKDSDIDLSRAAFNELTGCGVRWINGKLEDCPAGRISGSWSFDV